MEPIKLYVGENYKEPKLMTYTELLFPFWGVVAKESMPYVRAAALQYQYSKNDFSLVDTIAEADYVLMPYNYERLLAVNPERVATIIKEAHEVKKPLLLDGSGDIENPIDIPNSLILRVSQYSYNKKENEITIPFIAEDLVETFYEGDVGIREKPEVPEVGFTGWASMTCKARVKLWIKELPIIMASFIDSRRRAEHKGLLYRARALSALEKSEGIITHFRARGTYSGHVKTITGNVSDNRREFVETLRNCDYALAIKGDANSSVRFYEALSMGRIPLFLDTACVLPLEDVIAYRDFCVFVDWKDTDVISEKLLEFHASVSPERFKEMQVRAREVYREYLRVDAFSKHLANILRERCLESHQ